jgi:3-phenylpropionate/trans-cinnamate dioxygenase ferredoxin subunit
MLRAAQIFRRRRDDALIRVCARGELADGEIRRIPGFAVMVCNHGGRLYALGLFCPHAGARLIKGVIVDGCIECPLHGARFALKDGMPRRGPAGRGVPVHDVVVRDGAIYVARRPRRLNRPVRPLRRRGARR